MSLEPIFNVPKNHTKEAEQKIFIRKQIVSPDNFETEYVFWEMILHYKIPDEKRYRWLYLFKCRSGRVFIKSLEFGHCCSVSPNDPEFVTRGKPTKCKENTIVPANAEIYEVDPLTNELRLDVTLRA
jgi:hypothetical protein